jgi:23S rRNA (adenine2030-N6)-methyltransferase
MQTVQSYDHRVHAGNAGDVWKHFVLAETADLLLESGRGLVYAESHVGRPEYLLGSRGEWIGGIGRCWKHLPSLLNFCYFKVLADLNPHGLWRYPGSARLVLEASMRHGSKLQADVWDIDSEVAAAWTALPDLSGINFHKEDGFSGVVSLLDRSPPGLLLIDPPYVDAKDVTLAEDLLFRALERGWMVLWWSMMGTDAAPQSCSPYSPELLSLRFADAGMECGRWDGAIMALHGANHHLIERIQRQAAALLRILKYADKNFFKETYRNPPD